MKKTILAPLVISTALSSHWVLADHNNDSLEELIVWSKARSSESSHYVAPSSVLNPEDFTAINVVTTEDVIKYEPSLVVRRRFIGDANGTLGIRGANMFQTSRSMVFADGVPLHNLLQSRWNGAPRWSMVSASEIAQVEVIYGPFSAEYRGNAMGGVVEIETAIPQEEQINLSISAFSQEFDAYQAQDHFKGHNVFGSYSNTMGNTGFYVSYNRLDNDAQPQSFRGAAISPLDSSAAIPTPAAGGTRGYDARLRGGQPRELYFYGDTGKVNAVTDNYKLKINQDFGEWQALLNVVYEDRTNDNSSANSYLQNADGNPLWSGTLLISDSEQISVNSRRLNHSELERKTLSTGLRLQGNLSDTHHIAFNINQFDIMTDENASSSANPNDPSFNGSGQLGELSGSGWQTANVKWSANEFLHENISVISGLAFSSYELQQRVFANDDYRSKAKQTLNSVFGGETSQFSAFSQWAWQATSRLSLNMGLRYEDFSSDNGYYSASGANGLDIVRVPTQSMDRVSPKFSAAYQFNDQWQARYSLARAYRFPIAEELFSQFRSFNSINEANPELKPEAGTHHNLMLERALEGGYLRINVFYDDIDDAIESQTTTIIGGANDGVSVRTFAPIDNTQTRGAEFVYNQHGAMLEALDIRFNLSFVRSTVEDSTSNPQWKGNTMPRQPKWRSNLLATYHLSDKVSAGVSAEYASNAYGRLENNDTIKQVFGAIDGYTFFGLKANYEHDQHWSSSIGIDNIGNTEAYVAHPWPGRTVYLTLNYQR